MSAAPLPSNPGLPERQQATRGRVERLWLDREVRHGQTLQPGQVAAEFGIGLDYARQLLRDLRVSRTVGPALRDASLPGWDWRDRAACLGADPELFFPDKGEWAKAKRAKAICQGCSVQSSCLDEALHGPQATNDEAGIFGGTTPRERRGLRGRAWMGAPVQVSRDRDLADQALQRAHQVGRQEAARELGVSTVALAKAWQRFGMEPPPRRVGGRHPPTRFYRDRAAAEAILARAREVGIAAAAREAGVSTIALDSAWRRWGLERPRLPSGRRPARPEPTPALDQAFLALNPALASTLPRRASGAEVASRLRRLEELETLTPRVRAELHDENAPRPAVRQVFIARRARQAVERAQTAAEREAAVSPPAEERRQVAERLAQAHARRAGRRERDRLAPPRALEIEGRER